MTMARARGHELADALPSAKRQKLAHNSASSEDVKALFAPGLLDESNVQKFHAAYEDSTPYKHAVVPRLFQEDLLVGVKDECVGQLSFTQKETDIYKVNQTGDLASLDYLDAEQLALLPNLVKLRNALYSPGFTSFLRSVTGCGPLSVSKRDMSVNSYTTGCHLLNHDDVIGSRRVSYILYMPLPHSKDTVSDWKAEWGGSLELYPTDEKGEPSCLPSKSVPPSWNQFIFFEVQPGKSFHSVEEVIVGSDEDDRARLSISGWFHCAQEGEEGFEAETTVPASKSSREQLANMSTVFTPYSPDVLPPIPGDVEDDVTLPPDHTSFLSEYLDPVYLQARSMKLLSARFVEESSLELHDFLAEPLARKLESGLRELDAIDNLGPGRSSTIPPHSAGISSSWQLRGPPHSRRYCALAPASDAPAQTPDTTVGIATSNLSAHSAHADATAVLRKLQDELLSSEAFRIWLAAISKLVPLGHNVEARRFRPGLDYTLATSEDSEARLDVIIGLTPQKEEKKAELVTNGKGKSKASEVQAAEDEDEIEGWPSGAWGGWECYMAPHEDGDPAVYGPSASAGQKKAVKSRNGDSEMGSDDEDEEDDDSDGTLLTVSPGFNRLLAVLRDEKVMRFVKYVSAAAQGSRWDVYGEYEVGMVEDDDEGSD